MKCIKTSNKPIRARHLTSSSTSSISKCVQQNRSRVYIQIHQSRSFLNQNPWSKAQIKAEVTIYLMIIIKFSMDKGSKRNTRAKLLKTWSAEVAENAYNTIQASIKWTKYIRPIVWPANTSWTWNDSSNHAK